MTPSWPSARRLRDDDARPARLAALLRDQITSGMIASGAQLPPIGALRHQHGHSPQTVTKAMGVLQDEGLICRWPGLGYFVADKDE